MALPAPDNVDQIPKVPQGNPQSSIDTDSYRAYVSAAIMGLIISNPKTDVMVLVKRAHQVAEEAVFEQNRRKQIFDYNYTNFY